MTFKSTKVENGMQFHSRNVLGQIVFWNIGTIIDN